MWCWKRLEKIGWTDFVRNEEILHRVKEETNILNIIKWLKATRIGHILRRSCLLKHIWRNDRRRARSVGKLRKRRKQLLDYLKVTRGYRRLKEKTLDRTAWRTFIGRGNRHVIRMNKWMNEYSTHVYIYFNAFLVLKVSAVKCSVDPVSCIPLSRG